MLLRFQRAANIVLAVVLSAAILAYGGLGLATGGRWLFFVWLLPTNLNGCSYGDNWYGRWGAADPGGGPVVWRCFDDNDAKSP